MVRFGSVRLSSARFCSVRFGSVLFCSVLFGSVVLFCSAWFGSVQLYSLGSVRWYVLFWFVLICSNRFYSILCDSVGLVVVLYGAAG